LLSPLAWRSARFIDELISGGIIISLNFKILFSKKAVLIIAFYECPRAIYGNNFEKPI
jgi:hypothetical protein